MAGDTTTYSFKDLNGSIIHALMGAYIFDGAGIGSVRVEMATDKTSHKRASDGSIMVSYLAGDNGNLTITCQQTSRLHKFLVNGYNALKAAAESGQVNLWASATILLRNSVLGTSHMCTGVSFQKMAGLPYEAEGQDVTWVLMAADIQSVNA